MSKAKQIVGLECSTDAIAGIRLVLRARIKEVSELGKTALQWSDAKDVHSFRIALHRLRSAMRDFKPYLQIEKLSPARRQLKDIAKSLSAVRNQDAVVAVVEKLQLESPFELSSGIQRFIDDALNIRDQRFNELIKAAGGEALEKF